MSKPIFEEFRTPSQQSVARKNVTDFRRSEIEFLYDLAEFIFVHGQNVSQADLITIISDRAKSLGG